MVFFSLFRKRDLYRATLEARKMARGCWAQVSRFLMLPTMVLIPSRWCFSLEEVEAVSSKMCTIGVDGVATYLRFGPTCNTIILTVLDVYCWNTPWNTPFARQVNSIKPVFLLCAFLSNFNECQTFDVVFDHLRRIPAFIQVAEVHFSYCVHTCWFPKKKILTQQKHSKIFRCIDPLKLTTKTSEKKAVTPQKEMNLATIDFQLLTSIVSGRVSISQLDTSKSLRLPCLLGDKMSPSKACSKSGQLHVDSFASPFFPLGQEVLEHHKAVLFSGRGVFKCGHGEIGVFLRCVESR